MHIQFQLPTLASCAKPAIYIGAADESNVALLNSLLTSNWKNCAATIYFTEPGAVFVLSGSYQPSGNIILDASELSAPITLTSTAGARNLNFFKMVNGGFVARNIVFANNARVNLNIASTGGGDGNGNILNLDKGMAFFESCHFLNNSQLLTAQPGVSAGAGGGALRFKNVQRLLFNDCVFEGNSVTTESRIGTGGAVMISELSGPAAFNRCTFSGNKVQTTFVALGRALTGGGAVFVEYTIQTTSQSITFTSCTFDNNEVQGLLGSDLAGLGGFYVAGGAVASDPTAPKATRVDFVYTDCTFVGNNAIGKLPNTEATTQVYVYGGAVSHTFGTVMFTSCTFRDNAATNPAYTTTTPATPNGVWIFRVIGGGMHLNGVDSTIESCAFHNNVASGASEARGGGLGVQLSLSTAPFLSNTTISKTSWTLNKVVAKGAYARNAFGGGYASACATNIPSHPCRLSVTSSKLTENSAMLVDTTLSTTATAQGGGMYVWQLSQGGTITGVDFKDNQAYGKAGGSLTTPLTVEGGGLYLVDSVASVIDADFSNNNAKIGASTAAASLVDGGGLTVSTVSTNAALASKVELLRATFLDNMAGGFKRNYGGAAFSSFKSTLTDTETNMVYSASLGENLPAETSFNDWSIGMAFGTSNVITTRSHMQPTAAPTRATTESPTGAPTAKAEEIVSKRTCKPLSHRTVNAKFSLKHIHTHTSNNNATHTHTQVTSQFAAAETESPTAAAPPPQVATTKNTPAPTPTPTAVPTHNPVPAGPKFATMAVEDSQTSSPSAAPTTVSIICMCVCVYIYIYMYLWPQ